MSRHMMNEIIKRAESLGKSTAALASFNILSRDLLGLDNIVHKIKETNPDIEYIAVANRDMEIIAHNDLRRRGEVFKMSGGERFQSGQIETPIYATDHEPRSIYEIVVPVDHGNMQIGTVIIGINRSVLDTALSGTRRRILAAVAMTMPLVVLCTLLVARFLTRPIQELATGVDRLGEGHTFSPIKIYSNDELGKLTHDLNRMAELITNQQRKLGAYSLELEEAYISTIRVLAAAIDARDPNTHGHSTRVSSLSVMIGEVIGLSHAEREEIEIASLFHDVGKLKIPDYLLLKNGALSPDEYAEVCRHTEYGAEILETAPSLKKYIPAVLHHHEWYNGMGYPRKLQGEDIPISAAIISVADAFDAMVTKRPYRIGRSEDEAVQELMRYSGIQFHPRVIEAFLVVLEKKNLKSEFSSFSESL
jgi:HD-GYP domain-containing protein (c-di-GMP phosphodiesterase class II)